MPLTNKNKWYFSLSDHFQRRLFTNNKVNKRIIRSSGEKPRRNFSGILVLFGYLKGFEHISIGKYGVKFTLIKILSVRNVIYFCKCENFRLLRTEKHFHHFSALPSTFTFLLAERKIFWSFLVKNISFSDPF